MSRLLFKKFNGVAIALAIGAATGAATISASVLAQDYPTKPIRMIVPFTPAGPADIAGRLIAANITRRTGQPVVVENKPGAATAIGMQMVAAAAPDGYTVGFNTGAALLLPATLEKPGFDPVKDFTQITRVVEGSQFLMISTAVPAANYQEFIAYVKANPGKLNFGSASGNLQHLLFNQSAGVDIPIIPYKSTTDLQQAFAGGFVNVIFDNINNVNLMTQAGKGRVLATQAPTRQSLLPNVPSFGEILPGATYTWSMYLFGPAGMSDPVVNKLHTAAAETAREPEFVQRISAFGGQAVVVPPAALTKAIAEEVNKWIVTAKTAGVPKQ